MSEVASVVGMRGDISQIPGLKVSVDGGVSSVVLLAVVPAPPGSPSRPVEHPSPRLWSLGTATQQDKRNSAYEGRPCPFCRRAS